MDPIKDDPFAVLGFPPDVSVPDDELRRAYKALALKCHPDRVNPTASSDEAREAATIQFARISEAYQTCTDKVKLHDWRQRQEELKKEARYNRARAMARGGGASSVGGSTVVVDGRGGVHRPERSRSPRPGAERDRGRSKSPRPTSIRTDRSKSPSLRRLNFFSSSSSTSPPKSNKPKVPKARFLPFSSPRKQRKEHPTAKNPSAPWQRQHQDSIPPPAPFTHQSKAKQNSPRPSPPKAKNLDISPTTRGAPSSPRSSPRSKSPGQLRCIPSLELSRDRDKTIQPVVAAVSSPTTTSKRRAGTKDDFLKTQGAVDVSSFKSDATTTTVKTYSHHSSSPTTTVHPLVSPRRIPKVLAVGQPIRKQSAPSMTATAYPKQQGRPDSMIKKDSPPRKNKSMPATLTVEGAPRKNQSMASHSKATADVKKKKDPPSSTTSTASRPLPPTAAS